MPALASPPGLRPEQVRAGSWAAALALVAILVALALSARYPLHMETSASAPVEALIQNILAPRVASAPSAQAASAPANRAAVPVAAAPAASPEIGAAHSLALLQCASAAGRQRNAALCAGFSPQRGPMSEIAIAPVEGVLTNEGALQRQILRSVNVQAGRYALGEAQRYIDPRQDPIFEEGADPATAAHRPCASGHEPRGTGEGLTGRTCQVYR